MEWMWIDREKLRSECGALAAAGGLLSVVGGASSGRIPAARIACAEFRKAGLRTLHVPDAGNRSTTLRYVVEFIIDWAIRETQTGTSGLSSRASNVTASTERMFAYCVQAMERLAAANGSGTAVVVTALGQDAAPHKKDLQFLRRLAEASGGVWVVVGQDGNSWPDFSIRKVVLKNFTRQDVAHALRRIVEKKGGDTAQVPAHLDRMFSAQNSHIEPLVAYEKLRLMEVSSIEEYGELL